MTTQTTSPVSLVLLRPSKCWTFIAVKPKWTTQYQFESTCVTRSVTGGADRNQIIERIVAELTSFYQMMHW
jgi:hypothetical protein